MINWKGFGRKRLWSNFKILFRNFPEELRISTKTFQDSRSPNRDLNPGPPEYEAEL
jgi:hypothetical protein